MGHDGEDEAIERKAQLECTQCRPIISGMVIMSRNASRAPTNGSTIWSAFSPLGQLALSRMSNSVLHGPAYPGS